MSVLDKPFKRRVFAIVYDCSNIAFENKLAFMLAEERLSYTVFTTNVEEGVDDEDILRRVEVVDKHEQP